MTADELRQRLAAVPPAAAELLRLLTGFGAVEVPGEILACASQAELPRCAGGWPPLPPTLVKALEHPNTLRALTHARLLRLERHRLRVEPDVRALVDARLTPDQRAETRQQVHRVLAAANPWQAGNAAAWPRYEQVGRLLAPAGLLDVLEDDPRRIVASQVLFLYRAARYQECRELAWEAIRRWTPHVGPQDRLVVRVAYHRGRAVHALGDPPGEADARAEAAELLERCRRVYPADHGQVLVAMNLVAADRRRAGQFTEAAELDADAYTYASRRRELDAPQPRPGDGEGALRRRLARQAAAWACSLRALGDVAQARQLDDDALRDRLTYCPAGDPERLASVVGLAWDLLGLGRAQEARDLLGEHLPAWTQRLGREDPEVLRAAHADSVALRALGDATAAYHHGFRTVRLSRIRLGETHPETLAAQATLATILPAINQPQGGRILGERTLRQLRGRLGADHPHTLVFAARLAGIYRTVGATDDARTLDVQTHPSLERQLGTAHPATLAAAAGLAADAYRTGQVTTALARLRAVHHHLLRRDGADHPRTLAAEVDLALCAEAAGRQAEAATRTLRLGRLARTLGEQHPVVRAAAAGGWVEVAYEPPPL